MTPRVRVVACAAPPLAERASGRRVELVAMKVECGSRTIPATPKGVPRVHRGGAAHRRNTARVTDAAVKRTSRQNPCEDATRLRPGGYPADWRSLSDVHVCPRPARRRFVPRRSARCAHGPRVKRRSTESTSASATKPASPGTMHVLPAALAATGRLRHEVRRRGGRMSASERNGVPAASAPARTRLRPRVSAGDTTERGARRRG
jgi:hypothetical protein